MGAGRESFCSVCDLFNRAGICTTYTPICISCVVQVFRPIVSRKFRMEIIDRKRKVQVLVLLACCLVAPFWANSQRAVKIRQGASENLITVAESQLGVREATGNNDGAEIRKYLKSTGLPEGYPWCAAFTSYIHNEAGVSSPHSARVVDWFKQNVVWQKSWGEMVNAKPGMVGGLYYRRLGRLGHIFLIVGQDKNNFYTIEGNTNIAGSREGDGVYRKIRSKKSVAALADYCLNGRLFIDEYDEYLQKILK